VGTNRLDIQNNQGIYINRDMRAIAMNGSGYYEYKWINPISNQIQSKVSYVSRANVKVISFENGQPGEECLAVWQS
jgi:signal transduction histidine kinase